MIKDCELAQKELELDLDLCFKELRPVLELNYSLVWKRYANLSKAAQAFLTQLSLLSSEPKTIH